MRRFEFNKLIRSKLPFRMKEEGVIVNSTTLNFAEYLDKLKDKLIEEATEVSEAKTTDHLVRELGDVMEVIKAIAKANDIDMKQVEQERMKKREINGHFSPENYVHYIEVAEDNHKVIEYLENKDRPYKYTTEA